MKHIFIVNPASGSGGSTKEKIVQMLSDEKVDWEIYETRGPHDATRFVSERAEQGDEVRFYACGGDGTIKEVAEGAVGHPNASVSAYPVGSGNDYIKYYGGKENFLDIKALIRGENHCVDMLRVGGEYSVNIVNFGFDTCVARTMIKVKNRFLIGGKNAYTTGVVNALLTAMKSRARIFADGEEICSDKFLLCTAANGQYVGGAFRCAPRALNDDGFIDVCLVTTISRLTFVKLLGSYTEGKHLDDPRFSSIITYRRCKKLEVIAEKGFAISVDGEIVETEHFTVEVVPGALLFGVPEGAHSIMEQSVREKVTK